MIELANTNTYIVESPVENYCGIGACGIHFAYGRAEVQAGWVLEWFRSKGYKITPKELNFDRMTKESLVEYAKANGIDLGEATRVDDIRAVVKAAQ